MARSKRPKFAADVLSATGGEVKRFLPSHVRADHAHNTSRWAPYDTPAELVEHLGPKCCFTLEQIEKRLASLLSEGQLEDVTVSISGDGYPDLVFGFLRHAAFLLAEVRGSLDTIPGAKGMKFAGIRAKVVQAPKTQADHAEIARKNLAENRERQEMSPVDLAFYAKRRLAAFDDEGNTPSREDVAKELGMSKRTLDNYIQLTSARPEQLMAVHTGMVSMSGLLSQMRDKGQGTARGRNPGVQRKAMRRRKPEQRPTNMLSPPQIDALIDVINGDKPLAEVDDADVVQYVRYFDAPPEPKPAKPKKKAPPKPGKKTEKAQASS